VPKKKLYGAVKVLQKLGGSGVLVQPMTYIFDEEPQRWKQLLTTLGLSSGSSTSSEDSA
jgi:ATP phosphoribosyltransferase